MKILIACSEAVPYVKTGGLADVAGSLLKELRRQHEEAFLVLPLYASIKNRYALYDTGRSILITIGNIAYQGSIYASSPGNNAEAYFIECDELFGRPELYGTSAGDYRDNARRFIFFSRAVLEFCRALRIKPDVIHCNDWQTALVPLYLKTLYKESATLAQTASLFSIHNLGYQGVFDASTFLLTGLGPRYFSPEGLEYYGKLNLMKAGLLYADMISTVSETYAQEIQQAEYGFGLDGVMRKRARDLYGILNGLDYEEWNPAGDRFTAYQFDEEDLKGKMRCRKQVCTEAAFGREALPIAAVVGRLSSQKGIDLILESLEALAAMGVNLIVLGKGDAEYERLLAKAADVLKGRLYVHLGFDESLAHRVYAGSDFFLMPSRYEPCGLGQLIAMRYGTIPIARRTGGPADTIQDYDHLQQTGTGFLFSDYSASAMLDAVKRALSLFASRKYMKQTVRSCMKKIFPWSRSAEQYRALYHKAVRKAGT